MIEALFAVALATAIPLGVTIASELTTPIRRPTGRWISGAIVIACSTATLAVFLGRGPLPAILAGPWWLATFAVGAAAVGSTTKEVLVGRRPVEIWRVGLLAATGFLVVGATWAVIDRAGLGPFGFGRTIVLLTAVHFHVAGFVLTLAGSLVARDRPGVGIHAGLITLIIGTPLTALGFFGFPIVSWLGPLLVAGGGIGIGATTIAIARLATDGPARACLLVGGATLFLTMPLAAAYATGTTFGIAFLDIPAMAAIHGGLNVVGFAVPTMAGWRRVVR